MSVRYFNQDTPPSRARENDRWNDTATGRRFRWRAGRGWVRFIDRRAQDRWKPAELQTLQAWYPREGAEGVARRLPRRKAGAIESRARRMRLLGPEPPRGMRLAISGDNLDEAIRLHLEEGVGWPEIGRRFGVCEAAACNAVLVTLARRNGVRVAERDNYGYLTPIGRERIREALRKGWKGVEIVARLGVTAGTVSNERRRYNEDLKARGKRPLPPPGGGQRYSGARVDRATKRRVEELYLSGHATPKVRRDTGVSNTHCLRIRTKLIKRLSRKGECLPNCDISGVRLVYADSRRNVPPEKVDQIRALLMQGVSFKRAGLIAGVGDTSAYRIRTALKAELEAKGAQLPKTVPVPRKEAAKARWLPIGARWIYFFRVLADEHGEPEARRIIEEGLRTLAELPRAIRRAIIDDRRRRGLSFEEQLDRVRNGAGLVRAIPMPGRALADVTFGGVATGQLA